MRFGRCGRCLGRPSQRGTMREPISGFAGQMHQVGTVWSEFTGRKGIQEEQPLVFNKKREVCDEVGEMSHVG